MAEAPLSLLIERGRLGLVADARALAPGVRLRALTLRPGVDEAPAAVLAEGPAGVRRILGGALLLEEAEIELRAQAAADALAGRLCGRVIGGVEIVGVDVAWAPGEGRAGAAIDLQIRGRDRDRIGLRVGARLPVVVRGRELWIGPGQGWASPRGAADPAIWAALRLAIATAPGIAAAGSTLRVDLLRLLVDPWLIRGGRRALRAPSDVRVAIEGSEGSLMIRFAAGERRPPAEHAQATIADAEAAAGPAATPSVEAETAFVQALASRDAGTVAAAASALSALAGRWRPEALAREIAGSGRTPAALAALELLADAGDRSALARLAVLRGLEGDRPALSAMLARGWRLATHPVARCRFRLAWALTQGGPGDGPAGSRHALEALAAELGDGRWPAAVAGEVWSSLALARAADAEIDPELAHAAAVEASIHLPVERAAEVLRRTAIELHERGAAAADVLALQTLRAADRLGGSADPELADRIRGWGDEVKK